MDLLSESGAWSLRAFEMESLSELPRINFHIFLYIHMDVFMCIFIISSFLLVLRPHMPVLRGHSWQDPGEYMI